MQRVLRPPVAVVCVFEALAIVGHDLGIPGLRRLPTVTRLCGGHPLRCAAVLVVLGAHLFTSR